MAHKTVVKKMLKWLPVSVEFLEMANKDEKTFKVSDEKTGETEEIIVLDDGMVVNGETGEIIKDPTDDKEMDKVVEGLFPGNN